MSLTEPTTGGAGSGSPAGGCIYSAGSVDLFDVRVSDCSVAANTSVTATGGAVATIGDLTLRYSSIVNSILSNTLGSAFGGGVNVNGVLTSTYSTISDNSAVAYSPYFGGAGGALAVGGVVITGSAVINNHASDQVGGLGMLGGYLSTIVNSTISGNSSGGVIGGLLTAGTTTLSNSTVAFNAAVNGLLGGIPIAVGAVNQGTTLDIQSSMISNNFAGGTMLDLSVLNSGSVTGADSLVMAPVTAVPADTLVGVDPQLAPLANSGGLTLTHAIALTSPALDVGNNAANLLTDQRGPGFPRTLGGGTDIGAFELDADRIFADGFDG